MHHYGVSLKRSGTRRTFVQKAQRRDVRALAALKEDELALRVEQHLQIVLALAHDERVLLREDVLDERLERRILLQNESSDGALVGRAHRRRGFYVVLLCEFAEHGGC